MNSKIIASLLGISLLIGCGRKEAKSPDDLKQAFESPKDSALATAKPEVKMWVDQAVTALKADDQASAAMSLKSLRGSGQLSAEQAMAVQDMMAKTQQALVERAARGDQQAIAALNMLTMNPPR
ncbi:MAG: hypothetical protein ACXWJB_14255 [Limisphaerales bacterium]